LAHFQFVAFPESIGDAFIEEMQQVLRDNTTPTDLDLCFLHGHGNGDGDSMPQIITALGDNTTLKNCKFHMDEFEDRDLSEAMRSSLERNSTLESLTLQILTMHHDGLDREVDNAGLAPLGETVSFIRINASFKSLTLVCKNTTARDVGHLRLLAVSALAVNTSLDYLDIEINGFDSALGYASISSVDCLATLAALGSKTTLKTLRIRPKLDSFDS
jgi:hypothetical protein